MLPPIPALPPPRGKGVVFSAAFFPARLGLPDLLRGTAVLLMLIFHLCYDLDYFQWLELDLLHGAFWYVFQRLIVGLFVAVAGVSLVLASRNGLNWARFWRREAVLLGSAMLVSIGSYVLFPASWIFFGVLHFMAFASVAALPFLRLGGWNLLLGSVVLLLPWFISGEWFNAPWLQWLGLGTMVSATKDYTPFFPWFGVLLVGIYMGSRLGECGFCQRPLPAWRSLALLSWLGRHSLAVYLLHQPLLMGIFWLLA